MKLTRQEDKSVYLYIRDKVLAPEFAELTDSSPLVMAESGKWDLQYDGDVHPFKRSVVDANGIVTDYSGLGRGLVYFEVTDGICRFGVEQDTMVLVYDGGTILERGVDYTVNYVTGQIYSSLDLSSYSADFWWHYISVLDAWPDDDVPDLPVVSVMLKGGDESPQELGRAGGIKGADWHIEVFGNSKGERDDIMDTIVDGLKLLCPIYTFDTGIPLLWDGTYNTNFEAIKNTNFPSLSFENVKTSLTSLPRWGFWENERINKYRGAITFSTKAYQR